MRSCAGLVLDGLNLLCVELGECAKKQWISNEGDGWEYTIHSYAARNDHIHEPDGIGDNKWLLEGISGSFESQFKQDFFEDPNCDRSKLHLKIREIITVRNRLAHDNSYPSSYEEAKEALVTMIAISEAFSLSQNTVESLNAILKDIESTYTPIDENLVVNKLKMRNTALEEESNTLRDSLSSEKQKNSDLTTKLRECDDQLKARPKRKGYYKKLEAEHAAAIEEMIKEINKLNGEIAIIKRKTSKSDLPIEDLEEFHKLIKENEILRKELEEANKNFEWAKNNAKAYRSAKETFRDSYVEFKEKARIALENYDREVKKHLKTKRELAETEESLKKYKSANNNLEMDRDHYRTQYETLKSSTEDF